MPVVAALATVMVVVAACGGASGGRVHHRPGGVVTTVAQVETVPRPQYAKPAVNELSAAERPRLGEFPAVHGRSLFALQHLVRGVAQLVPATGVFTPGTGRYAFGLVTSARAFVYAPTALYLAPNTGHPVLGPFLAPADPMTVPAADRSEENAGPDGIQAVYATSLPLPHAGTYSLLALTRAPFGLIESVGEVAVAATSPIPAVGQRPPDVATDTLASVGGKLSLLTTRIPPEHMNAQSLSAVLGHEPVALLFSTPALCVSQVCGPVTDVVVSLQHEFAGRMAFIHQEVYVANDPTRGYRPAMKAFHLRTEPWLFVINRHGIVTARLEGAFGVNAARAAIESGLR